MITWSLVGLITILLAFAAFHQWLRHQRRLILHRERLAAIEKGTELPPVEEEIRRRGLGGQRVLVLAGLIWISLGVGALLGDPSTVSLLPGRAETPTRGAVAKISFIPNPIARSLGIALVGIGLSHLVVFAIARIQDRNQ